MLIYIVTEIYTVGIEVDEFGIIYKAPPIVAWAIGKDKDWFHDYLRKKGYLIEWKEIKS